MSEQKPKSKYYPEYRLYKPNSKGTGAASKFQIRIGKNQNEQERVMLFLESSQQTGTDENDNAAFAWKDKEKTTVVKLGLQDVGEFLSVLNGVKNAVGTGKGLYHQSDKGNNAVINFSLMPTKEGVAPSYWLKVSVQRDGKNVSVQHAVTLGEAEILRVLLSDFVRLTHGWY